jgi:hypothetical protein
MNNLRKWVQFVSNLPVFPGLGLETRNQEIRDREGAGRGDLLDEALTGKVVGIQCQAVEYLCLRQVFEVGKGSLNLRRSIYQCDAKDITTNNKSTQDPENRGGGGNGGKRGGGGKIRENEREKKRWQCE